MAHGLEASDSEEDEAVLGRVTSESWRAVGLEMGMGGELA